ncbi:glycine cleavage system aminomethyltransferase GcvT [Tundrisphaera lichenicola]|uniref:glycine cleavage system aminomethyltransferase GcvT n=1 Tax=Tundrisphaera lichenicola TaxID=2029860 RepID=UPI003EBAA363
MSSEAFLKTPLHDWHQSHGGRLVEFGGWSMPVQYSTIIEEHQAVRNRVGIFDIGHMGRIDFDGPESLNWLERVTTNRVSKLAPGQVQYSLMVDEQGGILDDILVYRKPCGSYAMVCNASNRPKVLIQLELHRAGFEARMQDQTFHSAMIAIQGPAALAVAQRHYDVALTDVPYYTCVTGTFRGNDALISRTGYTGEDGFELVLPKEAAVPAWEALMDAGRVFGVLPCGLGARDTLRFEAAMPLYGHEMDETVNPYAVGLGWAVKLDKGEFVGRESLRQFKSNPGRSRVGLALEGKRIPRQGYAVQQDGEVVGSITSGTFAPTLGRTLAMALVRPDSAAIGTLLTVDVRGHDEPAQIVKLPFYRRNPSQA